MSPFLSKTEQELTVYFNVPLYLIKSLIQRCVSVDGFIIARTDRDTHQIVFDEVFTQPSTFQIRHLPKCIKTGHVKQCVRIARFGIAYSLIFHSLNAINPRCDILEQCVTLYAKRQASISNVELQDVTF